MKAPSHIAAETRLFLPVKFSFSEPSLGTEQDWVSLGGLALGCLTLIQQLFSPFFIFFSLSANNSALFLYLQFESLETLSLAEL